MARIKIKGSIVVWAIILLAICIVPFITGFFSNAWGQRRLKLPIGNVTPAICLSERHGLILASDGSLWSWGSDFLGWPVLGTLTNHSPSLRRIGHETNWIDISVAADHNLAVKSDGTLWAW